MLKKAGVYDKNKLFGVTTLDIIRSNTFVAELKGKQPGEVEVPVIGGHSGVTILPLLSQVPGVSFTEQEVADLTKRIQNAGTEVVEAKAGGGSATLSMGQAAARFGLSLVRALQGEQGVVECAYVEGDGQYARFYSDSYTRSKYGDETNRLYRQNYALTWNGGWDNGVTTSNWVQYEHTRNSRIPEGLAGGTEGKFNEKATQDFVDLILQDTSRTLEEEEIAATVAKCVEALKERFQASLRD